MPEWLSVCFVPYKLRCASARSGRMISCNICGSGLEPLFHDVMRVWGKWGADTAK